MTFTPSGPSSRPEPTSRQHTPAAQPAPIPQYLPVAPPGPPTLPVGPGGRLPLLQALLGAVLFFVAQLFAGLAGGAVVALTMLDRLRGDGGTIDPSQGMQLLLGDPAAATVYFGTYAVVSMIGFALLLRAFARADFHDTFRRRGIVGELSAGTLLGAGLIGVGGLILLALGVYRGTDPALNGGILIGTMLGVGAAFGEEVFFRGFLLRLLDARFGSTVAVAVLTVVFGLVHVSNGGAGVYGAVAIMISAGLLLNVAYILTGRLWLPIGIHFAWNAMQSAVFGTDVSGSGSGRGLFAGHLAGPDWLSGGTVGMEGSVVVIALGLAAGVALTVLAVRRGRWRSWSTARAEVARAKQERVAAKAALESAVRPG